jgi:hypothetical protein
MPEDVPIPNCNDILDMIIAVTAKNDTEANRYHDGEMSSELYLQTCLAHMSEITWIVSCNHLSSGDMRLIDFWTRHRNFAKWNLVKPRPDGYEFLA